MMSQPLGVVGPADRPVHYEIRVRVVLDRHWSGWFEGLQVSSDAPGQTLIAGPVADKAALHGLLAKGDQVTKRQEPSSSTKRLPSTFRQSQRHSYSTGPSPPLAAPLHEACHNG